MADIVSPKTRSRMMSGIRGKNTKPEMAVRKGLFRRGFRYRIHAKHLPGKPDLVLAKHNAIIFVHGCFWHHHDCKLFKWPKSNTVFWRDKINANTQRDKRYIARLKEDGWRVLVVWECALKRKNDQEINEILDHISGWLLTDNKTGEILEGSLNGIKTGNI